MFERLDQIEARYEEALESLDRGLRIADSNGLQVVLPEIDVSWTRLNSGMVGTSNSVITAQDIFLFERTGVSEEWERLLSSAFIVFAVSIAYLFETGSRTIVAVATSGMTIASLPLARWGRPTADIRA
jgi:hypothetical protein